MTPRSWTAIALGVLLAGAANVPCRAQTRQPAPAPAPAGRPGDPHLQTVDYDPATVVRITGAYRTATQILFGEDEAILQAAIGDASAWDVMADRNLLDLKPKANHGPTNMVVTTTLLDGRRRTYNFELIVRAHRHAETEAVYLLRFRYPADLAAKATTAISAEEQRLEAQLLSLKLDRGAVEGRRNLAYEVQGAAALQPSEVSDNGRFTLMRFPAGQAIPAIYQVTPEGTESLVPFDVRGEFVVIHSTAKAFRLRRGRDVLCVYNDALDPFGASTGTHTASSEVDRTDAPPASKAKAPEEPARHD